MNLRVSAEELRGSEWEFKQNTNCLMLITSRGAEGGYSINDKGVQTEGNYFPGYFVDKCRTIVWDTK